MSESPKPKTSADYAMILATPPRNNRMVNLRPQTPSSSLITSPVTISPKASPYTQNPKYQDKPTSQNIIILEPDWENLPKSTILKKVFPEGFYYIPDDIHKTRTFYEFILVDSKSAEITHFSKNNSTTTYSKILIKRVITPEEWNQHLFTSKTFSEAFVPQTYHYMDYQTAWYNTLFYEEFNHSWFIYFSKQCPRLPRWFQTNWFDFFGPSPEILPKEIQDAYHYYQTLHKNPDEMAKISYTKIFGLCWIFCWKFDLHREKPVPYLKRKFMIKWWPKFEISRANIEIVKSHFKIKDKDKAISLSLPTRKEALFAMLEKETDPLKIVKIAQEISRITSEKASNSGSDLDPLNEDDCFGIELEG